MKHQLQQVSTISCQNSGLLLLEVGQKIKSMDYNFRATASTQLIGNTGSHKASSPSNSQTRLQKQNEVHYEVTASMASQRADRAWPVWRPSMVLWWQVDKGQPTSPTWALHGLWHSPTLHSYAWVGERWAWRLHYSVDKELVGWSQPEGLNMSVALCSDGSQSQVMSPRSILDWCSSTSLLSALTEGSNITSASLLLTSSWLV